MEIKWCGDKLISGFMSFPADYSTSKMQQQPKPPPSSEAVPSNAQLPTTLPPLPTTNVYQPPSYTFPQYFGDTNEYHYPIHFPPPLPAARNNAMQTFESNVYIICISK